MNSRLDVRSFALVAGLVGTLVALFLVKGKGRRELAFVLGWFVPGAGHVALGKRRKGLFFFALLGLTYVAGMWMSGFRTVSFDDNPFYFVGQYGSGMIYFLARTVCSEKAFPRPDLPPSWYDPGLLYVCVVGLLNIVVMLNVLDIRIASPLPAAVTAASTPATSPSAPASPEKPA